MTRRIIGADGKKFSVDKDAAAKVKTPAILESLFFFALITTNLVLFTAC